MAMTRLLVVAASLSAAGLAGADLISFQDPATGTRGYAAQDFEAALDQYDTYQLDDLDLGLPGWHLESAVTYWHCGIVDAEFYRIRTYSDLPDSWDTNQYFIKEYWGVSAEHGESGLWEVTFDLEGDAYSGTIWIAGYVRADFEDVGQDFWWNANAESLGHDPYGSEEYFWNYGGFSWPYWPRRGSEVYGETADMSWKIEGTPVPEPSMIPLLVLVALSSAHLRRKRG